MEPPPEARRVSVWVWFFAGTSAALGLLLAVLLWALFSSGLISPLVLHGTERLGLASARVPASAARESAAPVRLTPLPEPTTAPTAVPPTSGDAGTPSPDAIGTPPAGSIAAIGEIIRSGPWQVMVNHFETTQIVDGGRRVVVDFTIKNAGSRGATLIIPSTLEVAPRRSQADTDGAPRTRLIQFGEPPALVLRLEDETGAGFGGAMLGADGDESGTYNFLAAPGDAIRLPYVFRVPRGAVDPLRLRVRFGADAGGADLTVALDPQRRASTRLMPTDPPNLPGTEQRVRVGEIWSLTLLGVVVGPPGTTGARPVTLRLSAENLTSRPLVAGATLDDPTGQDRDFFVVDRDGRLAYINTDAMPRVIVPPRATRTIEVGLAAPESFATTGPYRVSIIVNPRLNFYALFRIP